VRRVRNEPEVADYLTDRGFEVVALEERPFREQVQLFAEAEVVVAQHGAGLINLLFAQSPRVLEILSDQDRQIYFSLISKSRGFIHEQWPMDGTDKNDDVTVPVDGLQDALISI
jgi:capsular polysaccharide biosynthesis protein